MNTKLLSMCALMCACTAPSDPGPEMMLPPPAQGLQVASPEFTLQPGEEVFKCFYTSLPIDSDQAVTRYVSRMTPGSHHFILYLLNQATQPDGTFGDCGGGANALGRVWAYASQDPDGKLEMPAGVAFPIKARQPVMFDMHYLNASTEAKKVQVVLNMETATGTYEKAGAFITFNTQISVPGGGTQKVEGNCSVPSGAKFFTMSTHSHKYTTSAMAGRSVNGAMTEMLVETSNWEHPGVALWKEPYTVFNAGEKLYYTCSYSNPLSTRLTVGESANTNEMCMAVGYFFPATGNSLCLNSR
jgi:hypothetical protein